MNEKEVFGLFEVRGADYTISFSELKDTRAKDQMPELTLSISDRFLTLLR